ncbi:MAG TPA: hypothetical protein GXZ87_08975 [Bacteroidales bacterium]|nr:hypothetical protein [Bacteroidales bacterium]
MNKNQFFNLKRFTNYSKNLLLINAKSMLISVAVLFVVMFLLQFSSMPRGKSMMEYPISNYAIYFTFYIVVLGVFIGSGFKPFNQKVDTRNYLAVPVSTFEKYLTEFLFRVVIGTIGILVIYWSATNLARYAAILTLTNPMDHYQQIVPFSYKALFEGNYTPLASIVLSTAFAYIALFNIRLFFNKHGLLKTVLTLSILFSAVLMILIKILESKVEKFANTDVVYAIDDVYFYIIFIVGIVGLSIFGYFKLKEKEL